jgi:pyrroline-5-carboxylate reductase
VQPLARRQGALVKIAFIGGGNMARALIGGLLQRGFSADAISVTEIDAAARTQLSSQFAVRVAAQPGGEVQSSEVVLLAIKPQQMRTVAAELRGLLHTQLVITIAAGVRTADLARWLGGYARIVRVMPNTPALVLAGISALYAGPTITPDERQSAESILAAVGSTLWVEREEQLDAVTGVSGSGPAYVFYFMEALEQAGRELGLDESAARSLSLQTFVGAARLAEQSAEDPAELRARVTSKGGTTERALSCMTSADLKRQFVEAVKQAAERSRELGEQLGTSD